MTYTAEFYREAQYYNSKRAIPISAYIDTKDTSTREYVRAVADFQAQAGLSVDGKCGPMTLTAMRDRVLREAASWQLTYDDLVDLAEVTSQFEGDFDSMNKDGEYRGLFDRPPEKYHWASKHNPKNNGEGKHIGLSWGYIQFTQDGGKLGKLLTKMHDRDPALFKECFGAEWEELLEVTNRKGRKRVNGRSPRVQPVGGADLWEPKWARRFRKAGQQKVFQRCQVELAVDDYMFPALESCEKLNLRSARSIVMVFDRGVQYGPRGAYKKLLKPNRDKDHTEHEFLRRFLHKYDDRRWGHRVKAIWRDPDLWDGPCNWTYVRSCI